MPLPVLVALVFLVSTAAIVGLYVVWAQQSGWKLRKVVGDRLQEVHTGGAAPVDPNAASLIRTQAQGLLPSVDRLAGRAIGGSAFERWLQQPGSRVSLSGLVLVSVGCGLAAAFASAAATGRGLAAALGFVVGAALPFIVLRYKRAARLRRFEELFPEALDLISRAVQAGHAFAAALKMVADEMADPVGQEFRDTFDEQNFGIPMEEALHNLARRVPLLDVQFFVTAVLIQRDTGGNLAEILDNLAHVVRERFKIRRQVRTHTAHGRFTGYVLLAVPAFLAVALTVVSPEHMGELFNDPMGQKMILVALVMQAVGWIWIKQVVKIEV